MSSITQKQIEQTFIEMLNEQPFSRITVKALTDRSGISRNCFYYHFSGIPELMDTITHKWVDEIIGSIPADATVEESCSIFLDAVLREKKMILHIYSSLNRQFFDDYMMRLASYITDAYISSRKKRIDISEKDISIISSCLKHEFFGQCLDWLNQRMSYDLAKEMRESCTLIDRILTSIPVDSK